MVKLREAGRALFMALKFDAENARKVDAAWKALREMRTYAESLGCDIGLFGDERYAVIEPVPETKKKSGRYS